MFRINLQLVFKIRYNNKKASGVSVMEKNYSYAEFMKAVGRNSSSIHAEKLLNEIYMDLFLKRIHRQQVRERLIKLIDYALDHLDKESFLVYSKQLIKIDEVN